MARPHLHQGAPERRRADLRESVPGGRDDQRFSGKGELSNFRSDNIYWDVCLNADGEVFIGNAYIVSFDVGIGVDPVPDQKVISGKKAMEPKPTKGNDTLFGWKTEDGAFFDFDTPITRNMTLTAAWAHPGVIPVDEKGTAKETLLDYHAVTEDVTSWSEDGWYCAPEDVTLGGRVNVTGKVDLLLRNGRTLTANGGIYVQGGGQLTVWAESTDDKTMGKLIAQGGESSAGIGGVESESHGAIVINGGHIQATGGRYGAAIGGGEKSSAGTVTINDGYVYTEGGKKGGAGIGSGNKGDFTGAVTIAGGTVLSNGDLIDGGAGIGAGFAGNASGGLVKITGGDVTAFSLGNKGAGIGGGNENWSGVGGEGGRVEIHGGKVMASAWGGGVYPVPDSFKNASAIGHGGTDKVNGDLVIMPGLKVRAGVNTANVNLKLYETHDAASACHERIAAVIEPCDHPNPTYVSVTSTGHTVPMRLLRPGFYGSAPRVGRRDPSVQALRLSLRR